MKEDFVIFDAYTEEINECMPHFVFYRRGMKCPMLGGFGEFLPDEVDRRVTDCYCTVCHERYEDKVRKPSEYKHKTKGTCAYCGAPVEYRQMNLGRSSYWYTKNLAVFSGTEDVVRISCVKASQFFKENELEPDIYYDEVTRYQLEPGRAVQYKYIVNRNSKGEYIGEWIPKKTKAVEPNFASGGGYYYRDSNYTVINHDCINDSFLKYLWKGGPETDTLYITWLCRYAEHQQLEYFLHGNVPEIAQEYVKSGLGRDIRLNWKSNDMKKVLRLSKAESNYIAEEDGRQYRFYVRFRKEIFKGKSDAETIKYFKSFGACGTLKSNNCYGLLQECKRITGLSYKKIMDYCLRKMNNQGTYYFMVQYKDYLKKCVELKYDMASTAIIMPKDMFAAHDKAARRIKDIEDHELNELMAQADKSRGDLEVVDMELGLILELPKHASDIVEEGTKLCHCVADYVKDHVNGKTTILFLRTLGKPTTPYYTMEVGNTLEIEQCYGKYNNRYKEKPEIIIEFERRYSEYLKKVEIDRRKAKEKAKRKNKKQHKAKAQIAA